MERTWKDVQFSASWIISVADSNKPISQQLIREAKIGLTIVALLVGLFCYVAWNRFTGNWDSIPDYVAQAPVAQNMNEVFREQHRLQMANLDRNSPSAQRAIPTDTSAALAVQQPAQTYTRGALQPQPDDLTVSRRTPNPISPITTNDLRNGTNNSSENEVEQASFEEDIQHEKEFDDPFGSVASPSQSSSSAPTQGTFVPGTPRDLTPRIETPSESNLEQQNRAKLKNTPEKRHDGFRPRNNTSASKQPRAMVTMQSTRFQVQVDPEPVAGPYATKPEPFQQAAKPVTAKDQNAFVQDTLSVESLTAKGLRDDSPQGSSIVPHDTQPDEILIKPHLPLTKAEDFAKRSLHPKRPQLQSPPHEEIIQTDSKLDVQAATDTEITGTYLVEDNQMTLFSIAQDVYGDGRLFRALYERNRNQIPDPGQIRLGTRLNTPPLENLVRDFSDLIPQDLLPAQETKTVYVTANGDTLFDIARHKLGQASRFDELVALNRRKLPLDTNHLSPLPSGMQIRLPIK